MKALTQILTAVAVYAAIKLIGAKVAWGDVHRLVKIALACVQSVWW